MRKNGYLIIAILGIIILLFVLAYVFFLSGVGGSGVFKIYKIQATCDVTVNNPLTSIGKLTIDHISYCTSKKVLFCTSSFTSQSIISTSGRLILASDGIQNSIPVEVSGVPFYNSKKYQISLCGMSEDTTSGILKTMVDNNIQDTYEVSFQNG